MCHWYSPAHLLFYIWCRDVSQFFCYLLSSFFLKISCVKVFFFVTIMVAYYPLTHSLKILLQECLVYSFLIMRGNEKFPNTITYTLNYVINNGQDGMYTALKIQIHIRKTIKTSIKKNNFFFPFNKVRAQSNLNRSVWSQADGFIMIKNGKIIFKKKSRLC